jgi:hypothetical protein
MYSAPPPSSGGAPLVRMMNVERRKGKDKPVIKKALVDLGGLPFRTFAEKRDQWAMRDCYRCPGPIQLDTTGKQRRADGTHVDPLCLTLQLQLKERREAAKSTGAGAAAAASGATASGGISASEALQTYRGLCQALLELDGGFDRAAPHDLRRLALYRLSHGIDDADNLRVLASLGVSEGEWTDAAARVRLDAAPPA